VLPQAPNTDAMVDQVDSAILAQGRYTKGDTMIITAGSPPGIVGTTNMVRVHHLSTGD
jgi:pyruvate kinase